MENNGLSGGFPRNDETPKECVARFENAAEIAYTPCGDGHVIWHIWGNGDPLLLLHGNHGSWTHWIKNIPFLSEQYRVLVPDAPGLGDSSVPPEPHSMDGIASIMNSGLDHLIGSKTRCHLAGFSYGSTLGGYMAMGLGARLKTFAMIGAARLTGQRTMVEGLINWKRLRDPEEIIEAHRHNLGRVMFSGPRVVDDLALYTQAKNAPRARVKAHHFARRLTLPDALVESAAQICTYWGTEDQYYPHYIQSYDEQIIARGLKIKTEIIEGAGHWAIYEASNEMNEKMLKFMTSHD